MSCIQTFNLKCIEWASFSFEMYATHITYTYVCIKIHIEFKAFILFYLYDCPIPLSELFTLLPVKMYPFNAVSKYIIIIISKLYSLTDPREQNPT